MINKLSELIFCYLSVQLFGLKTAAAVMLHRLSAKNVNTSLAVQQGVCAESAQACRNKLKDRVNSDCGE